jgi:hypothetical protein
MDYFKVAMIAAVFAMLFCVLDLWKNIESTGFFVQGRKDATIFV